MEAAPPVLDDLGEKDAAYIRRMVNARAIGRSIRSKSSDAPSLPVRACQLCGAKLRAGVLTVCAVEEAAEVVCLAPCVVVAELDEAFGEAGVEEEKR
jgi:hypothetical protein